jgi:hypothetical protein
MRFKEFFLLQEQVPQGKTFYHICRDSELQSILQQGLLAQQGDSTQQSSNEQPSVLLFRSLNDAKDAVNKWLRKAFAENDTLDLLSVSLPQNFPINDDPRMLEVISRADIPPSFIKLVNKNI